jgi:hypothetical protein
VGNSGRAHKLNVLFLKFPLKIGSVGSLFGWHIAPDNNSIEEIGCEEEFV